jgi:hypothetical protein
MKEEKMECGKDKESRNAYRILVEISLRKFPVGRLRLRHDAGNWGGGPYNDRRNKDNSVMWF